MKMNKFDPTPRRLYDSHNVTGNKKYLNARLLYLINQK